MSATSYPKNQIGIVLLEGIHGRAAELFAKDGLVSVRAEGKALEGDALAEAVAGAHLLGIRSKTDLSGDLIRSAERLLAVGCFCIGTNQVDLDAARSLGVPVFNSPFSNTRSVAELVIAEVVMLQRRLADKSAQMHAGVWDKSAAGAHEVRGMTLGIVGYGHIGSQVSVLAEAMGMRVLYHDLVPKLPLGNAVQVESLGQLLAECDVLTVHVPATSDTELLIGKRQFEAMRPGACVINNARGSVLDVDALAAALDSGQIGGAALDVFPHEPAGKGEAFESPLKGRPNVVLTPHIGGSTQEAQANIAVDVAGKLLRFLNNGSTTGAVNVPEVELPAMIGDDGVASHRILHFHKNVPGVLSKINNLTAELGANVSGQYLRTEGELGYVVLDVDAGDEAAVRMGLESIPETIRTRVLW